jgi:outer membrane protein
MEMALTSEANRTTLLPAASESVGWDEEKLVRAAKGGSQTAFAQLVERYEERVLRLARSVAPNQEDAEEIAQDGFAQAFKNLSEFRGDSRFYTWLVRITINAGLTKLRRHRVQVVSIDDEVEREDGAPPCEIEDCRPTPERWYLQQELQKILATSMGQLSPGHRAVFQLREVEGLSTEETARELDLSLAAVKTRLRRARLQMRRSLSHRFETPQGTHTFAGPKECIKTFASHLRIMLVLIICLLFCPITMMAQESAAKFPDSPRPHIHVEEPVPGPASPASAAGEPLTRQQAEQLALKNNPRISVAALLALTQKQMVREAHSAELPALNGNVMAEDAEEGTRLSATGSLAASRLLYHVGAGLDLNQLITDFGRTPNLVASYALQAKASEQNAQATREDIVLAVDFAFYSALEAQATLEVAKSTVNARQAVADQVVALTASNIKSTLDQSFAQANLSQAKLLYLDSQNHFDAAITGLNEVLGTTSDQRYHLVDDSTLPSPVAASADEAVALALQQRPDLIAQKLNHEADVRFSRAQHKQLLPTVSGLGVVGVTPVGSSTYFIKNWYGAAAVNVSVPIFNGFKFRAQASEADLRAKMSDEQSRVLVDRIVRDVRTAWLTANTAQQRMAVTVEFLKEANTALALADTRYRLGLSSIVELSQAQLQQTQAQIAEANARFDYEADLAALRFQIGSQP